MLRALSCLLTMASLGACAVSVPPDLEERVWSCEVAGDCLEGWTCADRGIIGDDFCAPACDPAIPSSCDGVCTAFGECLPTCTVMADGSSLECEGGRTCVRLDLFSDEGLCFPAVGCTVSSDCPSGTACLNDVFQIPPSLYVPGVIRASFESDQLYCTAVPEGDRCPVGYVYVASLNDAQPATCLPSCDAPARCPPLFSCTRGIGDLLNVVNDDVCIPGFWGLPCEDDTQCLLGRCLDVGGTRACTETCSHAQEISTLGCSLLEVGSSLGIANFAYTCDEAADVCVPTVTPGGICNEATRCLAGVCSTVPLGGGEVDLCLVGCRADADCALNDLPVGRRDDYYCLMGAGAGVCFPRAAPGARCSMDRQCLSRSCIGGACAPRVP